MAEKRGCEETNTNNTNGTNLTKGIKDSDDPHARPNLIKYYLKNRERGGVKEGP